MRGWYGHKQQHSLAYKGVRSGKVTQYKSRTSHEFADEFQFWTIDQIKSFEKEFGEIIEITSWNTIKTEDGEFLVFESEDEKYVDKVYKEYVKKIKDLKSNGMSDDEIEVSFTG